MIVTDKEINESVSIVIPAYDRADLLELTLKSIIKQKGIKYEIIVINDNSNTDDIFNICKKFNTVYHKNERNLGAQVSRNKGVDLAKYNYIAFIDSDDLWESDDKLLEQVQILKNQPKISIVFTSLKYIDINGKQFEKNITQVDNNLINKKFANIILAKDIIGTYSSVMVRKEDFIKCGKCNENLPARQDWDLWIRLSKIGNAFILDNIFTLYRIHDNQISSGINRKLDGFSQLLINHKEFFFNMNLRSTYYYHLSKLILLKKISRIESKNYDIVYERNKFMANIISIIIHVLIYIPVTKNLLTKKLSSTYLFKGLF